jgi:hypothetical protein
VVITIGDDFIYQAKDFEHLVSEVAFKFLKQRRIDIVTGKVKKEFRGKFRSRLRRRIKSQFAWAYIKYCYHLTEKGVVGEERTERLRAFYAEARRVADTEFKAKIETGTPSLVRLSVVQVGEGVFRFDESDVLSDCRESIVQKFLANKKMYRLGNGQEEMEDSVAELSD